MRTTRPLTLTAAAVASAALVVTLAAPAVAAPVRGSYLLKPVGPAADAIFPEGVATDGEYYYVGSTTDGTIYRGDLDRRVATPYLLGGEDDRTSAIGIKVSGDNLFVAGGATGRFFVYDTGTGDLVGSYQVDPAPTTTNPTFLNDAALAPDGTVYVTDSQRPVLYAVSPDYATDGVEALPVFLDFTGTALQYSAGFNVNGIAVSPDGQYLVLAKSNTRELYRVDLDTKEVTKIDLGGGSVAGDGLVLVGSTLYAIERQGDTGYVVEIALSGDLSSGVVVGRTTDRSFDDPTTAALVGDRLLVVNSQFGERSAGERPGPFTVSSIPLP